jgi:hypothetical protein
MTNTKQREHLEWDIEHGYRLIMKDYRVLVRISRLYSMVLLRYLKRWEIISTNLFYPHTCTFT